MKNKKKFNYDFRNKVVLIVGASRGIGFELAKNYLKFGANLMVCSKNLIKIKKAYQKLNKLKNKNQKIFYSCVDISYENEVKLLIKLTLKKLSKIDIIISNAGIYGPRGTIENVNWVEWVDTIRVNLFGPIFLCREIISYFKKNNKGKIIQLSGGGVGGPLPRISGYAISKIAVARFMENLSEEVKDFNIDINVVAPGAINTDMLKEILDEGPKNIGNYYYKKALKQKKLGGSSPKKACDLILFLSSRYSNGITGKILSALWDDWKNLPNYKKILRNSDIYTLKRINPKDRGFNWGIPRSKSIYDTLFSPYDKKNFLKKINLLERKKN
jgi:NAD(P)-dependent dehydrogenase (short-subunit alcohol dehydrogenase family)